MKRSLIQTLVLTIVLAGLIGWYFGYEKNLRPQKEETEAQKKQLVTYKKDEIQEVFIERPKTGETIKLKKIGDKWTITAPVEDSGDTGAVSNMLSTLSTTKYEDLVEENVTDPKKYGFETPTLKLTILKDGKNSEEITFGADTPVESGIYFKTKTNGNHVYRVGKALQTSFDKRLDDLRSKDIVGIARADVSEIEVQNTKGNILLTKGEKDDWKLPREGVPSDTTESSKLINAVLDARATGFVDEKAQKSLGSFGLSTPKMKIWYTLAKDKTKRSISGGKVGEKYYAKRDDKPVIYEVSKEQWDKWDVDPASLRSKEVASFNRFDVRRFKLEKSQEPVDLIRPDADWQVPSDPAAKIDNTKVDGWLTALQDVKIAKYGAKGKVSSPVLTIRLFEKKEKGEEEKVVLKLSAPKDGFSTVERSGLDYLFFIKDADFLKLNQKRSDFARAEKAPEPPKAAQGTPDKKS